MIRLNCGQKSAISVDMNWRLYATAAELKKLDALDKVEQRARSAVAERRAIYDRCRKRMERLTVTKNEA